MGKRPPGGSPPSVTTSGRVASGGSPASAESSSSGVLGSIKRAVSGGESDQQGTASTAEAAEPGEVFASVFERLSALETTQEDILDRIEEPSTIKKMGIEAGKGAVSTLGGLAATSGAGVGSLVPVLGPLLAPTAAAAGATVIGGAIGGAMSGYYEQEWEDNVGLVEGSVNRMESLLSSANIMNRKQDDQTSEDKKKY